jgi:guanine deaminase
MKNGHLHFLQLAVEEAKKGVLSNDGGPFGAAIVCRGELIALAHNEVLKTNDPTAHAEVVAIRRASAILGRFDLSDCVLYATCEPCPMCLAASYWAKIKTLVYACSRHDAARAGFDDAFIYEVLEGKAEDKRMEVLQMGREMALSAFELWQQKGDKTLY